MSQRQPTRERRCILFLKQISDGFTTENKHFIQHKPVISSQTVDPYFVRYANVRFGISIKTGYRYPALPPGSSLLSLYTKPIDHYL